MTPKAPLTVSPLLMSRSVTSSIVLLPFSPASTIRPEWRTASIASVIGCAAIGVSSSTTSAIAPSVISVTRSTTFSSSTLIVWSAPSSRASASLPASLPSPVTMIVPAPAARAAITEARPRWPGPRMSTVSPSPTSPRNAAQRTPAPSGLNITARWGGRSLETLCRIAHGCRYRSSPKPPHRPGSRESGVIP